MGACPPGSTYVNTGLDRSERHLAWYITRPITANISASQEGEGLHSYYEDASPNNIFTYWTRHTEDDPDADKVLVEQFGEEPLYQDEDEENILYQSSIDQIKAEEAYLQGLSTGEHTITAQFDDGNDPQAVFTVNASKSGSQQSPATKKSSTLPKTGDLNNLMTHWMLLDAALASFSAAFTLRRRRRRG